MRYTYKTTKISKKRAAVKICRSPFLWEQSLQPMQHSISGEIISWRTEVRVLLLSDPVSFFLSYEGHESADRQP